MQTDILHCKHVWRSYTGMAIYKGLAQMHLKLRDSPQTCDAETGLISGKGVPPFVSGSAVRFALAVVCVCAGVAQLVEHRF